MKLAKYAGALAASGLVVFSIPLRAADGPVVYRGQPTNSNITIHGTSTGHEWEMTNTFINGTVEFPAALKFDLSQTTLPGLTDGMLTAKVRAAVRVNAMHSTAEIKPTIMEGLMQDALKASDFPLIEFHVSELKLKSPHVAGQPFEFDAKGTLAVAGVTNKVEFPVTIEPVGDNALKISGSTKLKMTDYKVVPPAPNFGLGLMVCGDEVTIKFEWDVLKKP